MDESEARRKVAALTAIVQTMVTEFYGTLSAKQATAAFAARVADGEPLACAISSELPSKKIDHALTATESRPEVDENVLNAIPAYHYLSEAQRERAKVMRVAEEAVDRACEVRNTHPEREFADMILRNIAEDRSEPLEVGTAATPEDVVEQLPEPWRRHAKKGMESLRERVRNGPGRTEHVR